MTTYQGAVDACSSHGADVILPISQVENDDVMDILKIHRELRHFGVYDPILWLRVTRPDGDSIWVDAKTDEALVYDGPGGRFGGLDNWIYDWHVHAFMQNRADIVEGSDRDEWTGYPGDDVMGSIMCELPSL